jgi:hypothetical protein
MESSKVLYEMATQMRNITFDENRNPVWNCRDMIRNLFEMATPEEKEILVKDLVMYTDPELFRKLLV